MQSNEIKNIFNIEKALTAPEAGYLIDFRDAESLRNRAGAAISERRERLLSKGIRQDNEEEIVKIDWERKGEGRTQGNPNPTSPASAIPGSQQGTFQKESTILIHRS